MLQNKTAIHSEKAPTDLGPFSQGIKVKDTLYVSGQLPIDHGLGGIKGSNITEQTHQAIQNIQYILAENNMTLENIVKTTVLLQDFNDAAEMNAVYETYFQEPYPARLAYQVAALSSGALVEIEAVAVE